MKIDVLYFEGCPNHKPTVRRVRDVLDRLEVKAVLNEVEVTQDDDPATLKFVGSPTVLIDGMDIDPVQRQGVAYGFGCRTFGGEGVPPRQMIERAVQASSGGGANACCPADREPGARLCDGDDGPSVKAFWTAPASVGAAVLSSACCWLPLLLLAFGLSAGGVAGVFETLRPYLLIAAGLFLSAGFYFAYFRGFRKPACKPGETCAVPDPKLQRFNRAMLWVASVFVIAFALFPYYSPAVMRTWAGSTAGDASTPVQDHSRAPIQTVSQTYAIDGMTCRACAATLELELAKLPGVVEAHVSYEEGSATLTVRRAIDRATVAATVERAGFGLADEPE